MKQDFPALWAESPATLRRDPSNGDMANGFPCGPLDLPLWNELIYRLAQSYREISTVITRSGQTPSASNTAQLWNALQQTSVVRAGADVSTTPGQLFVQATSPALPEALNDYQIYEIVPNLSASGAVTIRLGSFTALPLVRRDGTAVLDGDVVAGQPFLATKLGNVFRRLDPTPSDIRAASRLYSGANTGSANALAATVTPSLTQYDPNAIYVISVSAANTTVVTVNLNGLGAKDVVRSNGTALRPGDISRLAVLSYDGTRFVLLNLAQEIAPPGSAFAGGQSKFGFMPVQGQTSTLTATFTVQYAGVVTAFSTLNTSSANGNISNTAIIYVNGTPNAGASDTISGFSASIINVDVRPGDVVTITSTVLPADPPVVNASQYLRYQFGPG